MIDIAKVGYYLEMLRPNGQRIILNPFLQGMSWEENDGELAVRFEAELKNARLQNGDWLHMIIPLGGRIFLYSDWGDGRQEIFRGTIFDWYYKTDPLGNLAIIAYDQLIYLTKSEDDRFYKAGMTAKAIIQDIAKAWGIPLGTIQGPNVSLAKQVYRGDTLGDMIFSVLDQAKKRGDGKWLVRSRQGKIDVIRPGQNNPVYVFDGESTENVEDRQDIEDLVTRVKIIGGENNEDRLPVVAQLDGRTEFGVLQRLVYQRQYDTPAAARAAARNILKEQGQPRRTHKRMAPDLPFLRKGDKVKIVSGILNGYYIVSSITHNATQKLMTMEVEEVG